MKTLVTLWLLATVLASILATARSQGNRPYPQQGGGSVGGGDNGNGRGDCRYVCYVDHCSGRRCFYTCNRPRYCEEQGGLLNTQDAQVGFDGVAEVPTEAQFFGQPASPVGVPQEDPAMTPTTAQSTT